MAERVTYGEFAEKVMGFPGLALVEFYSDACVPCKRMSPVLAALEGRYPEALYAAKVNVAYEKELAREYGVLSTPTLLFLKGGQVAERLSGFRTEGELAQTIESILGKAERPMKITVSGEAKEVRAGLTVAELLQQENVETPEYVSVSVNGEFVRSGDFAAHGLREGDVVEFLYFMGGGGNGFF